MKTIVLICLLALVLSGCGTAPVWEQVTDGELTQPVGLWQEDAYDLTIGVPEELSLTESQPGLALYETQNGDWSIRTQTFLASDLNTAVKYLSGYEADKLTVLQTTRFDLPEYRFVWYTQTGEGGRVCRGDLVMDGNVCYAVVSSVTETASHGYEEKLQQVFSSFGLSERPV